LNGTSGSQFAPFTVIKESLVALAFLLKRCGEKRGQKVGLSFYFFFFSLRYWDLNSGPTP
jgi:hypothetical protein